MDSRDDVKAITDKVFNMAQGHEVEVNLSGAERSGTRWANSTITTNLIQYDRQLTITVRQGNRQGSASTRDFSATGLREAVSEDTAAAKAAAETPDLPEWLGALLHRAFQQRCVHREALYHGQPHCAGYV